MGNRIEHSQALVDSAPGHHLKLKKPGSTPLTGDGSIHLNSSTHQTRKKTPAFALGFLLLGACNSMDRKEHMIYRLATTF